MRSVAASQTACCGVRVRAWLELADEDDLVPGPNSDGEGAGAVAKRGIGAVVGPLQGGNDAATVHPDEGGAEGVPREIL
jgi:hypothetical protein